MFFLVDKEFPVAQNAHLRLDFETVWGRGESDPVPPHLQDAPIVTHSAPNSSKNIYCF